MLEQYIIYKNTVEKNLSDLITIFDLYWLFLSPNIYEWINEWTSELF